MTTTVQFVRGQEARRRAWCQQKAVFFLLTHSGRRPFPWLLARIRRRWPRSAAGPEFEDRLRRLYDQDQDTSRSAPEDLRGDTPQGGIKYLGLSQIGTDVPTSRVPRQIRG